jgi:uncharacterized membrane protein YqhA
MKEKKSKRGKVERCVELFLWNYRFVIMLGVIGLLLGSTLIFLLGILETFGTVKVFMVEIFSHGHVGKEIYIKTIIQTITSVDDFLLATVLLIFGLGIYDLFISKLEPAEEQDDVRPHWLRFSSLDELKSTLGKVVLMIMIVNFLKYVIQLEYKDPVEVLYLGVSIAFIGLALRLSHSKDINRTKIDNH